MKRILFFSFGILSGLAATSQSYVPVTVSGYTADVIANGSGAASGSTTNDVDGGTYAFVSTNFVNPSGQSPATALPNNGTIQSVVGATPGLSFQLAPFNTNNSLRISGTGSGTVTLAAPIAADQVFVLATSGSGTSAVTITLNFTDNTTQAFIQTVADWFGASGFAIQGISRVNISTNAIQNSATDPRLYQYQLNLSAVNVGKPIQSILFTKTSTGGVLNVMGISARTVASSVANDVGIVAVTAPESGCGLTSQETVTVTLHNFGMNAQSNIPVSYILNGGTPVTGTFAGSLASNSSGSYTFPVPVDLSTLGTHVLTASTGLSSDTQSGNNSVSKTVVVSETPVIPALTLVGPANFCVGNFSTLSASSPTTGASYQWLLNGSPIPGATTAIFAAGASGSYSVRAHANGCNSAASAPVVLTSSPAPSAPFLSASGPTGFCSGGSVTLTASSSSAGATFLWLRDGTSVPGGGSATFTVTESGSYRAIVMAGGCASTPSNPTFVTVTPTPAVPIISQSGSVLNSSSGIGNQWFLNGTQIAGATGSSYVPAVSGIYTVMVAENGCSSTLSNGINVVVSGVKDEEVQLGFSVFPNPTSGRFTLAFTYIDAAEVAISDLTGRTIHRQRVTSGSNEINLGGVARGLYLVTLRSQQGISTELIMME